MEQQSRGDNSSFLLKKTIFLKEICSRTHFFLKEILFEKKFFKWKEKQERDDKNKLLLKKLEWRIFSKHAKMIRKWDVEKFLLQKQFLWRIFHEVQKIQICLWIRNFKKEEEKRWQTYLHQITVIQKIGSCGDSNKRLLCKKKSIYLVRTNTIENNNKKKGAKQQRRNKNSFTKKGWRNEKRFSEKN